MPNIGDIAYGRDIGHKNLRARFIWITCVTCGRERWTSLIKNKPISTRCHPCSFMANFSLGSQGRYKKGNLHRHWKGGRSNTSDGYVKIWVSKDHPFRKMAHKDGYVMEHRLIIAQHLNRLLRDTELVHHLNGNKKDNRIENLQLLDAYTHDTTYSAGYSRAIIDLLPLLIRR